MRSTFKEFRGRPCVICRIARSMEEFCDQLREWGEMLLRKSAFASDLGIAIVSRCFHVVIFFIGGASASPD